MGKKFCELTLEEKLGQLIIFGFDGLKINDHARKLIKEYKAGNVLLFTRNIKDAEQLFTLNKDLQNLAKEGVGIPLFITIDQEGGMITRIQNGGTFFPGAMTISASNDPRNAYVTGNNMAEELKSFLINFNFAPVMDVNNNPDNPVIGIRSYSDSQERVSLYGSEFIKGMQDCGVIATAKHFPGHGDTNVDTHLGLPFVDYDMKRIKEIELFPFKAAIDAGVKAIMTAHIVYKSMDDSNLPATLSFNVLTKLLRQELGFKGLIVADGLEMNAIKDVYGINDGAVMAINAGVDLLLSCHNENEQISILTYLKQAVLDGKISMDVIDERVKRILKYKENIDFPLENDSYFENVEKNKQHADNAFQIVKKAFTLVKGKPLKLDKDALFIGTLPKSTSAADATDGESNITELIKKEIKGLKTLLMSIEPTNEEIVNICEVASNHKQIIITSYNSNVYKSQLILMEKLHEKHKEVHVVSLRNPYDSYYVKKINNYVSLYEYTPNSVKVLIEYLKGNIKPGGIFPLRLIK